MSKDNYRAINLVIENHTLDEYDKNNKYDKYSNYIFVVSIIITMTFVISEVLIACDIISR